MKQELPTINAFANVSNAYNLGDFSPGLSTSGYGTAIWVAGTDFDPAKLEEVELEKYKKASALAGAAENRVFSNLIKPPVKEIEMSAGRLVQVFIADPDKNVPLDKRLLYKGEQIFTDASDQDLFFDIDIKSILKAHNELRATLTDKAKSNATEKVYLEPVRVSNLKMVVSELAKF